MESCVVKVRVCNLFSKTVFKTYPSKQPGNLPDSKNHQADNSRKLTTLNSQASFDSQPTSTDQPTSISAENDKKGDVTGEVTVEQPRENQTNEEKM